VLNSIGYSTRKLGDVDKGIEYYHQALAIDPNFAKARQYLGEAYLQKGDVAKAKEQLTEIADRCGGPCDDYVVLDVRGASVALNGVTRAALVEHEVVEGDHILLIAFQV
jgi:tetratricopeptide (TPR) repeat protein